MLYLMVEPPIKTIGTCACCLYHMYCTSHAEEVKFEHCYCMLQACLECFCTLLASRQTFTALKGQHPGLLKLILDNAANGVGIAAVDGWATNSEILYHVNGSGCAHCMCDAAAYVTHQVESWNLLARCHDMVQSSCQPGAGHQ